MDVPVMTILSIGIIIGFGLVILEVTILMAGGKHPTKSSSSSVAVVDSSTIQTNEYDQWMLDTFPKTESDIEMVMNNNEQREDIRPTVKPDVDNDASGSSSSSFSNSVDKEYDSVPMVPMQSSTMRERKELLGDWNELSSSCESGLGVTEAQAYVRSLRQLMYTLLKGRVIDRFNLTACFFQLVEGEERLRAAERLFSSEDPERFVWSLCNISAHCLSARRRALPLLLSAPETVQTLAHLVGRDAACVVKRHSCRIYRELAPLISAAAAIRDSVSLTTNISSITALFLITIFALKLF